jgi:threonylcarbamoyladenosine tRNA methylthiotransferase MtaB
MSGVEIITFGCRLNAFESDVIRRAAGEAGLADAVIVNTCAVTEEAERQARQAIRRARREHPGARIIVTGCAATLAPDRYAALAEVDEVLDNEAKLKAESYVNPYRPSALAGGGSLMSSRTGEGQRARAYLQVQQGCDHRCTFCIIPYARGPSRSVPLDTIIAQARTLVAAGAREIVLTGVDLTAYGGDLPGGPTMGRMARQLLAQVPELPRLRLSSLDPSEIDEDLWALFASEARLMPHLHLSLQAGDDLILKRMKRRHLRADAATAIQRARALRPGIAIGADLIAGFPTEDEALFRETLDFVIEAELPFLHVFPYSERPGTPAARMPAVATALRRDRAARLRAAGRDAARRFLATHVGRTVSLLTESQHAGRSEHFAAVRLAAPVEPGRLMAARIVGVADETLLAEAA